MKGLLLLLVLAGAVLLGLVFLFKDETQAPSNEPAEPMQQTSELIINDVTVGSGERAETGDTVSVHYTGRLENGTTFDSSVGRSPFSFTLGEGRVIEGWEQGVSGMRVGGTRMLTIPPHLAYGEAGVPGAIPPDATLIFEVELISIEN
jgi:peptidylprolyl isomerase/FKBP-type peptidyl-prolyl cis-trans isomerase FkpA